MRLEWGANETLVEPNGNVHRAPPRGEDEAAGGVAGNASNDWARVAAWVLGAGLDMGMEGEFWTIVGHLCRC